MKIAFFSSALLIYSLFNTASAYDLCAERLEREARIQTKTDALIEANLAPKAIQTTFDFAVKHIYGIYPLNWRAKDALKREEDCAKASKLLEELETTIDFITEATAKASN